MVVSIGLLLSQVKHKLMERIPITEAGAIIIGDEILSGYRQDAHMDYLIKRLHKGVETISKKIIKTTD